HWQIAKYLALLPSLKHTHRPRDQHHDNAERDSNLCHHRKFGPTRQERCIGWAEGRALSKSDKKIIDEAGPPTFTFKSCAFLFFDLHLRKDKAAATECTPLRTRRWATSIKPPVPESEYKHVCQPKLRPRSK